MASALPSSRPIAIVGSGAMGAGIAQVAAAAGHPVKLLDARRDAVPKAIAEIRANLKKLNHKGRMSAEDAQAAAERLVPAMELNELADAKLVIEAIVENLDVKRKLFAELEGIVGPDCILASNTSSLSITAIAAGMREPGRVLGMHFFNPAPLMLLVEVVSGLATDPAVAQTIHATAAAWGKTPVHAKSTPGFIVNRVARPFYAEALRLLAEQAGDPATLDAVMRESGSFRMGPFELMDLIGHDVNFAVTQSVFEAYFNDPRFTPSVIQQELVNAGWLGRKSGRGFYIYGDGAPPPQPTTESPAPPPRRLVVKQECASTSAILSRLVHAPVEFFPQYRVSASPGAQLFEVDEALLLRTDGRCATQLAVESRNPNVVLVDLAFDYASATRVALTRSEQCSNAAFQSVVGLFQAAGYAVSRLNDVPGMAVMRTVAMLANAAADVVNQGVCSADAVDVAMQAGANYPRGPLAWADALGVETLHTVLSHLAEHYGEDRYRISPLIQRNFWTGAKFHA